MSSERWYTVAQAAEELNVHPETLRDWLRRGRIRGTRINKRVGWRIARSELDRFFTEGLLPETQEEKLAA